VIERVILAHPLREQMAREARSAFPRECCGLIEGVMEGSVATVAAVHPTANLATDSDRFEIDPAEQIALLRQLRGTGREIIGCYHSHPNGRAEPSPRDRENAVGADFLWLIIALAPGDAGMNAAFGAFEIAPDGHREIDIAAA
jgi:proteasome lid subunit RPN8/RPN11